MDIEYGFWVIFNTSVIYIIFVFIIFIIVDTMKEEQSNSNTIIFSIVGLGVFIVVVVAACSLYCRTLTYYEKIEEIKYDNSNATGSNTSK